MHNHYFYQQIIICMYVVLIFLKPEKQKPRNQRPTLADQILHWSHDYS